MQTMKIRKHGRKKLWSTLQRQDSSPQTEQLNSTMRISGIYSKKTGKWNRAFEKEDDLGLR